MIRFANYPDPVLYGTDQDITALASPPPSSTMSSALTASHSPLPIPAPLPSLLPDIPNYSRNEVPKVIRHELYDDLRQLKEHMQLMETASTARANEKRKRRGLISQETNESVDNLSKRALQTQIAQICLCCAQNLKRHHIKTWNAFYKEINHADIEIYHRTTPSSDSVAVQVINTDGCLMTIDDTWFDFFICNNSLLLLRMFSQLHEAHILKDINHLRQNDEVLVYDMANIRCVRKMVAWKCDDTTFIMHLEDTAFPAACVVQRKNEMLLIHNI